MSRRRRWPVAAGLAALVAIGALAVVVFASAGTTAGDPAASSTATVNPTAPLVRPDFTLALGDPVGRAIPSGYLGFSIEFQAIRAYTGSDPKRVNPVLVQLIRNLTPGQAPVIRIGGDSTDESWVPTAGIKPPPQVTYKLTPSWFATTGALVRALGARVIAGINLGANQPGLAAAEARQDERTFGAALEAFEIGNEPNVYDKIAAYRTPSGTPVLTRPAGYEYPAYSDEFRAIARRLPALALAGPALAAGPMPVPGSWVSMLAGYMHSTPRLRLLTIHRYPLRNCFVAPDSPQYPTIANLLSRYSTADLAAGVRRYIELAHGAGRELRIDELNSVACRGKRGVSDTFAAGLWAPDALFELARAGVDGINMHTLPDSAYELFKFSHAGGRWHAEVPPVYYGLDLFSRAAPPGSRLLKVHGGGRWPGLSVWATRAPDGTVRVLLDNESRSRGGNVGLRAPAGTQGPVTLVRMRAPSVHARRGVSIGGASFGARTYTGVLGQPRVENVQPDRGAYSVSVPAASAALVTFSHR